jgi:hypothetical protein
MNQLSDLAEKQERSRSYVIRTMLLEGVQRAQGPQ